MATKKTKHRSGFASILGRPNAGKSTLLNLLVGTKVAIVASKPQTTRTAIQGVMTGPDSQVVFLDTPGVHQPSSLLHRRMMESVRSALPDRDLLLWVADASLPCDGEQQRALGILDGLATPVLLVLNKIDLVKDKRNLLPLIEKYRAARDFADFLPLSALNGDGVEQLREAVVSRMPAGTAFYPADHITDQPMRFLAAEIVREKILAETRQEVPHAVAVLVDQWEEGARLTRISATIYVERGGQKAIIIGAGASMLKRVGTAAREEIEAMTGGKVFLELFVKVSGNWRDSPRFLNEIDWRSMVGGETP